MKFKILIAIFTLSFSFINFHEVQNVKANEVVVNQDQMVMNVIYMIDNLPETCTLKDEESVKKCREAYDNLLPAQKIEVTNLMVLLERENQIAILYSQISYVVDLINNLPNVNDFDLNNEQKLKEVTAKYNELDNLQKELVSNYSKLNELINKLNNIKTSINSIIDLINNLPNVNLVDQSVYALIDRIEVIYYSLSDIQKEKITNINKYLEIKELLRRVDIIITSIDSIPSKLNFESLSLLESIQNEYLKLTSSQKSLVTNYEQFNTLYQSVLRALEFNDLINELIQYINLENKYLLNYLLNEYEKYNENQKVFITNYQKLLIAKEEIEKEETYYEQAQSVIKMINELPLDIQLSDKEKVRDVRKQYNLLSDNSKKYVDNYHLLLDAEANIAKLENEDYAASLDNVYNELNENLEEIEKIKEEVANDQKTSQELIEEIKKFINETKENEQKGFNKYIIIAIGLVSVFIIVTIIYVFSLNHKKINIDNEMI